MSWSPTGCGNAPLDEAMKVFLEAEVAAAPVYDAEQLLADEHLVARGTFTPGRRPGPRADDGCRRPVAQLSGTPGGSTTWAERSAPTTTPSTAELLGLDPERIAALRAAGVI